MVEAALAGLDPGEVIKILLLSDKGQRDAFLAGRAALGLNLSLAHPVGPYGVPVAGR